MIAARLCIQCCSNGEREKKRGGKGEREGGERKQEKERERRGCIHLINLTTTKQNIYCTDERIEKLTRMATSMGKEAQENH